MNLRHASAILVITVAAGLGVVVLGLRVIPDPDVDAVSGLKIGQSRQAALNALDGRGFYGWTCFRELAVYGDVPLNGEEHHAMAFVDSGADRVKAVEVAGYPFTVAGKSQCKAAVQERADAAFSQIAWSDAEPRRYFIGGGNRYFLRRRHADGRIYEVWGDHRGAASYQTCRVFWRTSVDGSERLEASGERRKRSALAAAR